MRFTEIAQLSAAAPGVTLEHREDALVMRLENAGGTGTMTCYVLFPGMTLAYIQIHARKWPAPEIPAGNGAGTVAGTGSLLINYCVNGRCEIHLNDNAYVYVEGGALSLTERYAKETYVYPRKIYEGLEFFIDREVLTKEAPWMQEQFGVSETSLKNYFHGVYGQNISSYMQGVRTRQAAELLTSTRISVSDIAREVGYLNQSKFASVFKSVYGMSPMEYRRSSNINIIR